LVAAARIAARERSDFSFPFPGARFFCSVISLLFTI